jgi:DNA-binding NtrC family response regulator
VRIVAATNRDAQGAVEDGALRQDLYYRLAVVVIALPPLRERHDDIPALVQYFNERLSAEYGLAPRQISPDVMNVLTGYDWPGNVRELENVIERAFALGGEPTIRPGDLPPHLTQRAAPGAKAVGADIDRSSDLEGTLETVERAALIDALRKSDGNRVKAAKALGIERKKLYRLLHKHGLMGEKG